MLKDNLSCYFEFWTVTYCVFKSIPSYFWIYRVIHKSLRDFRTRLRNSQDRHGRKEHINRHRISPSFFVLGALAYFQVPPLGGSREEKWRTQWIRKRSMSWNLPKLSQLWLCNGGFGSCTTKNHLQTKQFVNGTWIPAEWLPVRCETNRPSGPIGRDGSLYESG